VGNAAIYVRSSKDRSDVSIAAQKYELAKLAESRGLAVVRSYEDAVESGATEDRPGFSELVRALKDTSRGWTHLLVYDTSRIARRRYIAQAIKHEAKKRGVTILYARLPADLDPVAELVLESVFEAMDEAHSLMSREKGLAGMAENVRRGWRAGGRAPLGYRLEAHPTGAIRDGRPVTKSRLVPSEGAQAIRAYLKRRALGHPRAVVLRELSMPQSETTMIGIEWNALAYAGHTVWNRHAVQGTGRKRRPRSEWHITRNTHEALITDAEAEAILSHLETSEIGAAISRAKAASSSFMLTGLLYTSDGRMWVGHGNRYRLRAIDGQPGRTVLAETIDRAVADQFGKDLASDDFLGQLLTAARKARRANPTSDIEARIRKAEREKARAAELALTEQADSGVYLALVRQRSEQIEALRREADAIRSDDAVSRELAGLTVEKLRAILADRTPAKAIQSLVERVTLEPTLECRIEYKAVPGGRRGYLSQPLGDATNSHLLIHSLVALGRVA
jgi:site-specific DNA recombinase